MMSDTYQRIQAQSDTEWKFGRAILIRQMNKRSATPAPINMLTKLWAVLLVAYRNKCICIFCNLLLLLMYKLEADGTRSRSN